MSFCDISLDVSFVAHWCATFYPYWLYLYFLCIMTLAWDRNIDIVSYHSESLVYTYSDWLCGCCILMKQSHPLIDIIVHVLGYQLIIQLYLHLIHMSTSFDISQPFCQCSWCLYKYTRGEFYQESPWIMNLILKKCVEHLKHFLTVQQMETWKYVHCNQWDKIMEDIHLERLEDEVLAEFESKQTKENKELDDLENEIIKTHKVSWYAFKLANLCGVII